MSIPTMDNEKEVEFKLGERIPQDGFQMNVDDESNKVKSFDFFINDEVIISLSSDGSFYYKGEKVEDKDNVYNAFSQWINAALISKKPNGIKSDLAE